MTGFAARVQPEPLAVWQKGRVIPNFDPNVWRWDVYGSVIRFSDYGDRTSKYGWEIDHIRPISFGGSDTLANYRPLHWRNNVARNRNH